MFRSFAVLSLSKRALYILYKRDLHYAKKPLKGGVKGKGGGYLIYTRGLHSAKKSLKRG